MTPLDVLVEFLCWLGALEQLALGPCETRAIGYRESPDPSGNSHTTRATERRPDR